MCGISGFCMYDVKHYSALRGHGHCGEQSQWLLWGVNPGGLHSPAHRPVALPTSIHSHQQSNTHFAIITLFKILLWLSIISYSIKSKLSPVYTPFSVHPLLTQHPQRLPSPFNPQGWPPGTSSFVVTTGTLLPRLPLCLSLFPSPSDPNQNCCCWDLTGTQVVLFSNCFDNAPKILLPLSCSTCHLKACCVGSSPAPFSSTWRRADVSLLFTGCLVVIKNDRSHWCVLCSEHPAGGLSDLLSDLQRSLARLEWLPGCTDQEMEAQGSEVAQPGHQASDRPSHVKPRSAVSKAPVCSPAAQPRGLGHSACEENARLPAQNRTSYGPTFLWL